MKNKVVSILIGIALSTLSTLAQTDAGADASTAITVAASEVPSATNSESAVVAEQVEDGGTNATVIPLIVMEEALLTDAIKNLARQAEINYMLDPRITFGQPGPDGRVVPQPVISIRWENITAEQALNALLNNYNLQLVDDPKTRIARVTVKDPAAPIPLITETIQLQFASPGSIVSSVTNSLSDPRSRAIPDVRTSQLVVVATEKELEDIRNLIVSLDLPTKQVLIEARLIETSMNPRTIKGLNWNGTLGAQRIQLGNNLQTQPVTVGESDNRPLATDWPKLMLDTARGFNPATAFLDADGLSVVLSFMNNNSDAKVISSPRTVTLDNETATLSVTRATPIINVTAGTANTTGGSEITYTNLGVILNVTPRISANSNINLHVVPEVSRTFGTAEKIIEGRVFQADIYDIRKMETRVVVPSGHTLVLGGLIQDDLRTGQSKVPLLGDIPGLGRAFRHESKDRLKNNLMVFITPTIVQDADFQPTATDFLRTPMQEVADKEWSAWDSGKPYDWSKRSTRKTVSYDEQAAAIR